jgi:hypothetical protein
MSVGVSSTRRGSADLEAIPASGLGEINRVPVDAEVCCAVSSVLEDNTLLGFGFETKGTIGIPGAYVPKGLVVSRVDDTFITQNPEKPETISILAGTWNLQGNDWDPRTLPDFISPGFHDIYVICTQECMHSIATSLLLPSKAEWVEALIDLFGSGYFQVGEETLQAMHIVVFAKTKLKNHISDVSTASVATGIAGIIGNKGGVGVSFQLGQSSLLFVCAHFHAHQNEVKERNDDFIQIDTRLELFKESKANTSLPLAVAGKKNSEDIPTSKTDNQSPSLCAISTANLSGEHLSGDGDEVKKTAESRVANKGKIDVSNAAETSPIDPQQRATCRHTHSFWIGDLNYRIDCKREMVDVLIKQELMEVMLSNDQLNQVPNHRTNPDYICSDS